MDITFLLGMVVVIGLGLILLLIIWNVLIRRSHTRETIPLSLDQVKDARIEAEELTAPVVVEQIEEMVKEEILKHPDLSGTTVDFGTRPDGSLVIMIDEVDYLSPEDIPDPRIQAIIQDAVREFNA